MTTINLSNLASLKAYFKTVAETHADIDGFKWGEKKVIKTANRSNQVPRFLWAQPYDGARYLDNYSDNIQKVKTARISYMVAQGPSKKFDEVDSMFESCELVIEEIIARMYRDKQGLLNGSGDWEMIIANIAAIRTGPVEYTIGSTKYIGWEMSIDFQDPTRLAYDPARWVSNRTFDDTFDETAG